MAQLNHYIIRSMKKVYKHDLSFYLTSCEHNYVRVERLLPHSFFSGALAQHACALSLMRGSHAYAKLELTLEESCKYTSILQCHFQLMPNSQASWASNHFKGLDSLNFTLKLSHDARLLEIAAFQGRERIKPMYPYPNQKMYQVDERQQQQNLLALCLKASLEDGMVDYQPWQPLSPAL